MAAVKKAVSKVLHPKRELRERRRHRRENDDEMDGGSGDDQVGSNDASSPSFASSSRASQGDSSHLTSAFNNSRLIDSDCEAEDEMFEDAQEPDGAIIEHAAAIPDKGQDGIQEIAEPATSTSVPRSTAAHPNGQDPALAVQLKPTDRHYLNKALVQSV
jgi:hypothetical protein